MGDVSCKLRPPIMKGNFMPEWTLDYPVYSLDRRFVLPAGTTLSEKELHALVSSKSPDFQKKAFLMKLGTVKQDILDFMRQPPGNAVFSNEKSIDEIIGLMEQVRITPPMLDSIEYFKQYDSYTYRHFLMVFAYLTLIAQDLVPDYQDRIRERVTSTLHDMGKICVPLGILKKESPLTRDERMNVEHHTIAGYLLLSYYFQDTVHMAPRVARDHHERRNGSGYPRGICLNDRMVEIVAVCDIYDALTSPRPYRPLSFDNRTAIEEITMMAERNEVNFEVVQALVARNRKERPHFTECSVSLDKRGVSPPNNLYGVLAD